MPAVVVDGHLEPMRCVDPRGLFELVLPGADVHAAYQLLLPGAPEPIDDPYRFLPSLGELDLHLFGEGQHRELGRVFGAQVREHGPETVV